MDKNNQEGMTLVELLAAITILGILFVGFMAVFPQMTNFNERTEEKLETMNLARMLLEEYKSGYRSIDTSLPENGEGIIRNEGEIQGFDFIVDFYTQADLEGNSESIRLNKIHIIVKNDDRTISETFGYLTNVEL